jgi:GNAT superfamily N-acetyltransferase
MRNLLPSSACLKSNAPIQGITDYAWPNEEGAEYYGKHLANPASHCLLAELAGQAVGYLFGYVDTAVPTLRPVKMAELESMYVRPEHRGRQVGERLVTAFLNWCRAQGARRVVVTAFAANSGAIRFYERLGFEAKSAILERGL